MKYFAILRDSLRETIDSKVFFVVGAMSFLAILLMATVSLEPIPSAEGLQNIASRFPDGAREIDLPIVGKTKVSQSFTEYSVKDVQVPENSPRPWEAEYQFVIEARDLVPLGSRMVVLQQALEAEEDQERAAPTGRKTRALRLQEELGEEAQRIKDQEERKPGDRMEAQKRVMERFMAFMLQRLEKEVRTISNAELEQYIKDQLAKQGSWQVTEISAVDLPAAEQHIKIKTKVPVPEGNDVRITTKEADGEVHQFRVTVTPRGAAYRAWPHKATILLGAIPLGNKALPGEIVAKISTWIVSTIGAPAIMLLSCIITAFYIPNMLRKGTIDLLLAKPVSRTGLLIYKYIGGLTFMVINTTVLIVGLWLVVGLRTAVWEPAFLMAIGILTFEFALFYALSTLAAVLTRSPIVSILGCVVLWAFLFGLGWVAYALAPDPARTTKEAQPWYVTTAQVAHTVLPHYLDLDWLADRELKERTLPEAERPEINRKYGMFRWSESILVTSFYIVLFLGLACWRFSTQDY